MRVEEGIPRKNNHDPYHDRDPYQRRRRRRQPYRYPRTKIGVHVTFSGVGKGASRRKKRSTAGLLDQEASADEDDNEDDYGQTLTVIHCLPDVMRVHHCTHALLCFDITPGMLVTSSFSQSPYRETTLSNQRLRRIFTTTTMA
jgi:hypothetical protein